MPTSHKIPKRPTVSSQMQYDEKDPKHQQAHQLQQQEQEHDVVQGQDKKPTLQIVDLKTLTNKQQANAAVVATKSKRKINKTEKKLKQKQKQKPNHKHKQSHDHDHSLPDDSKTENSESESESQDNSQEQDDDDDDNDENDDNDDDSDQKEQVLNFQPDDAESDVEVQFEFFDPKEEEVPQIRSFLRTLLAGFRDIDLHKLAEKIAAQTRVGTTVRLGEQSEEVLGFVTCLNYYSHKDILHHIKVQSIRNLESILQNLATPVGNVDKPDVPARLQHIKRIFKEAEAVPLGVLLLSRFVNLPPAIIDWMHTAIFDEIKWAIEDEPTKELRDAFKFMNYVYITEVFMDKKAAEGLTGKGVVSKQKMKKLKKRKQREKEKEKKKMKKLKQQGATGITEKNPGIDDDNDDNTNQQDQINRILREEDQQHQQKRQQAQQDNHGKIIKSDVTFVHLEDEFLFQGAFEVIAWAIPGESAFGKSSLCRHQMVMFIAADQIKSIRSKITKAILATGSKQPKVQS